MTLSFDAIAAQFDDQRGLPAAALRELVAFFARVGEGKPLAIVEPGVGTGRIALPLALAGHRVTGIDISRPMLDQCAARAEALRVSERVDLLAGDATALPVGEARFDAGIIASLLYLVPAWERVLHELDRVIRPSGHVVVVRERTVEGPALAEWNAEWRARIEATGFRHQPFTPTDTEVEAAMATRWGNVAVHALASWRFGQTVADARRDYGDRLRPLYATVEPATWAREVDAFLGWSARRFPDPGITLGGEVVLELVVARTGASSAGRS